MATTPVRPPSASIAAPRPNGLSAASLGVIGLFLLGGVAVGGVQYAHRVPVHEHYSPANSAWVVHLALAGATLLWIVAAGWWWRRQGRPIGGAITAPLRRRAARRWLAGLRSPVRAVPTVLLSIVLLYSAWRTGEQVLAGLDPNFRINAWGGPTYAGSMFCHYLDGGLMTAAALVLLDRILPGRGRS